MAEVRFVSATSEILGWYGNDVNMPLDQPSHYIAQVARTCYKSEPKGEGADDRLVRSLIRNHHDAMLEHSFLSVRFRCDRAIANELVRHRMASFAQTSTRYVNSSKHGYEFILPCGATDEQGKDIEHACEVAASAYENLVTILGAKPEIARSVLPLCTATTIVVSANFREWRHIFELRCDKAAHPDMRRLMLGLLRKVHYYIPVIFDDIASRYLETPREAGTPNEDGS